MFKIQYYTTNNNCPIFDYLKSLPKKDQAKILREIDLLEEFGYTLGMPHIKKLNGEDNLWELRIKISTNNYRIFYFSIKNNTYLLLNAFAKKSNSTPTKEINTAIRYKNDYLERSES